MVLETTSDLWQRLGGCGISSRQLACSGCDNMHGQCDNTVVLQLTNDDTGKLRIRIGVTPRRLHAAAGPIPQGQTIARSTDALVFDNGHMGLEVISDMISTRVIHQTD